MNWNRYYKEQLALGLFVIFDFIAFIYGAITRQLIPVAVFGFTTVIALYVWAYRMCCSAYDEDKKNPEQR